MEPVVPLRVLGSLVLAYAAVVAILRVSGNRSLSKMRAFDLVVTVALGSLLASAASEGGWVPWRALLGVAALVGFQYAVAWLAVRSPSWERLVTAEPLLVLHHGRMLPRGMRKARVTEEEVLAALRRSGHGDPGSVEAVVLEADGSLSVLGGEAAEALRNVHRPEEKR